MRIAHVEGLLEDGLILRSDLGKKGWPILSYWRASGSAFGSNEAVISGRRYSDAGANGSRR